MLPNWGTTPARPDGPTPPSRFCAIHPHGTREACGPCANARTAFTAWQAEAAADDIAIAQADDIARQRRRRLIDACPDCDDFGRDDDLGPCAHSRALLAAAVHA